MSDSKELADQQSETHQVPSPAYAKYVLVVLIIVCIFNFVDR